MTVADEAMGALGVPVSYVEPNGDEPRDFDAARERTRRAHEAVTAKIDELVRARSAVNDEIKVLRQEEDRLRRMLKIADAPVEPGADE